MAIGIKIIVIITLLALSHYIGGQDKHMEIYEEICGNVGLISTIFPIDPQHLLCINETSDEWIKLEYVIKHINDKATFSFVGDSYRSGEELTCESNCIVNNDPCQFKCGTKEEMGYGK